MTEVEQIESATRVALVAEQEEIDAWWLRSNPAMRARRANSATVPPHGRIDVDAAYTVIDWYRQRSRPPIIRVLSTADPRLEAYLNDEGWLTEATTRVMVRRRTDHATPDGVLVVADGRDLVPEPWRLIRQQLGWTSIGAQQLHDLGRSGDIAYALAPHMDRPVAVGRAVIDDGLVGLYDIATLDAVRRHGRGRAVVEALVAWGGSRGATIAYLQVQGDNEVAIGLYEKAGFQTLYTYWYRRPNH